MMFRMLMLMMGICSMLAMAGWPALGQAAEAGSAAADMVRHHRQAHERMRGHWPLLEAQRMEQICTLSIDQGVLRVNSPLGHRNRTSAPGLRAELEDVHGDVMVNWVTMHLGDQVIMQHLQVRVVQFPDEQSYRLVQLMVRRGSIQISEQYNTPMGQRNVLLAQFLPEDEVFLVDCLMLPEPELAAAALAELQKVLGREVPFDLEAQIDRRQVAAQELREQLFFQEMSRENR